MPEERILEKVQKLLERANHPNTPEHERDACIKRADAMMVKHAIDAAMLDATRNKNERRQPISKRVHMFDPHSHYRPRFRTILTEIARTNRVRVALHPNGDATIVGFGDDVDWTEMLWLHIFREFVAKIDPRWESNLTIDQNVKALKEAGWRWIDIWRAMDIYCVTSGQETPCTPPPKDGGWLIRAYKRQCKAEGVEANVATQRHEAYRETFAEAFANRICERMAEMRLAAKEAAQGTTGAELALRDAFVDVEDLFYSIFEHLRPMTPEEAEELRRKQAEADALAAEKDAAWLASLTPAQREREMERREMEKRKQAAADDRYWRQYMKDQQKKYDRDGDRAGRRAADSVRLDRRHDVAENRRDQIQ